MTMGVRRRWLSLPMVALCVATLAAPSRAQLPPAQRPPDDDPRKGPRLEYQRGPRECLPEAEFRSEVAIAAHDGVDHLADDSPDVVRVRFERIPGGYRGTIEYVDATGARDVPEVQTSYNCEILARWVASSVSETIPRIPPPAPCPVATPPPASPRPVCPSCPACDSSQPRAPRPLPSPHPAWRMDLSVGVSTYVLMSAFLSADVAPGFGVRASVGGEYFLVGAEFRGILPSRAYAREPIPEKTANYPIEFDLSQLSALVTPCGRYKYFVGCGVAELGFMVSQTSVSQALVPIYNFGPRLGFEVPFAERFAVFGFGEALFAPRRVTIGFDLPDPENPAQLVANTQWVQSPAMAFFGVGFSAQFR